MDNLTDILFPTAKKLNLSFGEFELKPLSFKQAAKLGNIIGNKGKETFDAKAPERTGETALSLLSFIGENIENILEIVFDKENCEDFREKASLASLEDISKIVLSVIEQNEGAFTNFHLAMRRAGILPANRTAQALPSR